MKITSDKKIIFLDTSVFESQNFFKGRNLLTICKYSLDGFIELKITDIIYNELKNRISSNINRSEKIYKKYLLELHSDGKILKNTKDYSSIYKYPKFDSSKLKTELETELDAFLSENNIEIIDSSTANISDVFEKYFEVKPPFKEGNKKHEFPDAFITSSIENWAIAKNKNVFLISQDNDMKNIEFTSGQVTNEYDLSQILEKISQEINEEHTEYIDSKFEDYLPEIEEKIESDYMEKLSDSVSQNLYKEWDLESAEIISPPLIDNVEISISIINSLTLNESFSYEIDFKIIFEIDVSYIDLSCATYDKEDDIWFGYSEENKTLKYEADCIANAIFWYEFDGDSDNITFEGIEDFEIHNLDKIENE